MKIAEFIKTYKEKKFMVIRNGVDEKSEWIRKELEIKTYIPFAEKRKIAEMIVDQNIEVVDGIKKYDSINGYLSLIVASIMAHTNLEWSSDVMADYDLLAESGLLPHIIFEFQGSHDEIDLLLKMALAMELEDNNANVLIGHFLDSILKKIEGLSGVLGETLGDFDLEEMLSNENMAKIVGFLNK